MDPEVPLIETPPGDGDKVTPPAKGSDSTTQPVNVSGGTTSPAGGGGTVLPSKSGLSSVAPFVLGRGMAPVPGNIVKKIQGLEFVDLAELLPDNLELLHRLDATEAGLASSKTSKGRLRQISSLTSWAQCFFTFSAIIVAAHPGKARELMAYGRFILREAIRHGGEGWRVYDTLFRHAVATDKEMAWDIVDGTIYSTTFLAMRETCVQCNLCMESDHKEQDCALSDRKSHDRPLEHSQSQGPGSAPKPLSQRKQKSSRICRAFNFSSCAGLPECQYQHVCLRCRKAPHRVGECPEPAPPSAEDDTNPPAKHPRRA